MPRGAAPGERRGGREKGTPNKISGKVRDALWEALEADGGPVEYFRELRQTEPKSFAQLVGKLLPQARELSGPDGEGLFEEPLSRREELMSDLELARRIAFVLNAGEHALGELERMDKGEED
jgi:hypothetical protein